MPPQLILDLFGEICIHHALTLMPEILFGDCVNYYLFEKRISNNKLCPFCNKIETVRHLFLECSLVSTLNKIVLCLLRKIARNQICLSEKSFRYFVLPSLGNYEKQLALVILSESRLIIWTCRNLAKHEIKTITVFQMVAKFFNKLKMRIYIDKERMPLEEFYQYVVLI